MYGIVPAADPLSLRSSALWVVASSVLTCFARPRSGTFNGPRLVRYWVPCRPAMECLAFQQFHHQIRTLTGLTEVEHRTDIWVVESRERLRFTGEAPHDGGPR